MVNRGASNFDVLYVGDSFDSSEFVDLIFREEQDQDQWHVKAVACTEDGRGAVKTHHPNCRYFRNESREYCLNATK